MYKETEFKKQSKIKNTNILISNILIKILITYRGPPSTSSIIKQCLLKSIGFGTGKPLSSSAFKYTYSLVAEILERYNQDAEYLC